MKKFLIGTAIGFAVTITMPVVGLAFLIGVTAMILMRATR